MTDDPLPTPNPTNAPEPAPPPRPVRIETLSNSAMERLRKAHLSTIEIGLKRAGLVFRRRWPGLHVKVGELSRQVMVAPHQDHRWWRIYCSTNPPDGAVPDAPSDLTMCASEIDERTGLHLAALLRNSHYRWPLFEHHPCYPDYAWSKLGQSTFDEDCRARKAWAAWYHARRKAGEEVAR